MAPNRMMAPRRREEIIQATIRCLAREGYAQLTMKTLAREVGLSQGILHYYFADKAAILAAALQAVTAELERRITQAQRGQTRDPAQRLRATMQACLTTALESPEVWHVYVQLWGAMQHDAQLAAINAKIYTTMRRHVATLLRQGSRKGLFRPVDITHAAAIIVGLMDGVALQLMFDPQAFPLPTAVQCCYEAVERYLRP